MAKYLFKRILHGLFSVVCVVAIVMLMIYSIMDRNLVFAKDTNFNKQNNNAKIKLEAIGAPDIKLEEFIDPLQEGLRHEEYVTSLINKLFSVAMEYKDYKSMDFLAWFIKEQGEEELNAQTLIDKLELFATDSTGLYMLDNELSKRKYSAPDYNFG